MSGIIQLLPDHVANQIAAGEVVQRPASVVKELLENAVDAGASDIKLIIKDAGKTLIQVVDNGKGMNATDAHLCFERHATSKIRQAEDLFALHTKGFRGEALASIAAVAHVELKTRQAQDELGLQVVIEGGKFLQEDAAALPEGSSFSVKNLFFNIPARRNFLKSDAIEFRHIIDEFQRVALVHPEIYFSFYHNTAEVHILPPGNFRQRIVGIFAGKTNEKLVPVNEETDILRISGFVSKPEFSKKNKGEQFFFVNGRFIKSGYLHHAIMNAYEGLLKDGMQPSYYLMLEVPTQSIDINIHPTKTEVKFDDEQALYAILRSSVKHSLGQFNVAPILDFDRDANLDTPYHYKDKDADSVYPTIQVDAGFNPFADEKPAKSSSSTNKPKYKIPETASWESLYVGLQSDTDSVWEPEQAAFESEPMQSSLFSESEAQETPSVRCYQLQRKYIVNPIKSGLLVIDQQRAHQRILYEQFLTNMTVEQAASQQLLFPLELAFSTHEISALQELQASLEATGFTFDAIVQDRMVLSGIPPQIAPEQITEVLHELLHDLQEGIPGNSFSQNDIIAQSMAKSMSIKNGMYLSEKEQENLINGLFACKAPDISPFQKPTFITLRVEDLDKKFAL